MKFDDDALRASALSFQLIYRTRGLYQAFACLREFLEGHLPVARINGASCRFCCGNALRSR